MLHIFDIAERELELIAGGKAVRGVHDSSGVRGVGQAERMAEFVDCYSKQVEPWSRNTTRRMRAVWHREGAKLYKK